MDGRSDVELMRGVAAGDRDALAALYTRHQRALLRFVTHLSHDLAHAEDAVHEVFLRVWRAAARYEPRARFTTWLFQIAKNHWLTERDRRRRRPALGLDGPAPGTGDPAGPGSGGPPDPRASPHAEADRHERQAAVRRAGAALPEGQRLVVILADFQGLPYRDVAEILEIPVGTVKSRRHAADRRLRELLGPMFGDAGSSATRASEGTA